LTQRHMIRAGHIIGFQKGEHRYLRGGVVVWEGNTIVHVGKTFEGHVDTVIDAPDRLVTPGFVNTHVHISESPLDKSFVEDVGKRHYYQSGLYEMLGPRNRTITKAHRASCIPYSMAELIRTGTTTLMEMGYLPEETVAEAAKIGLRTYMGTMYNSMTGMRLGPGVQVNYNFCDEAEDIKRLDAAVATMTKHHGSHDDLIRGWLSPHAVDTVSEKLLLRTKDIAKDLGWQISLHTSQSVFEFLEMTRRNLMTPIEWLNKIGFLGPEVGLGHVIMIGGHSLVNYPGDDIRIMADTGTTVEHSPWVFVRRGQVMESFAKYLQAGINVTLGTDTAPQSMIEAMRWASIISKIVERSAETTTARDAFNAATINGAKFLKRDDLGRLAPGAKADLLVWEAGSMFMSPVRDPVKNIVYSAQTEDLRDVLINGRWVMQEQVIPGYDYNALSAVVQNTAQELWDGIKTSTPDGRGVDQLSPQTFAEFV
jgi:5-methylthioadenosine/S-adenosylhomocysteine deaminase